MQNVILYSQKTIFSSTGVQYVVVVQEEKKNRLQNYSIRHLFLPVDYTDRKLKLY
jgi:hypothetical protein